jgi:hypothetical protein
MRFVRTAIAAFIVAGAVSIVSAQTGGIFVSVVDGNGEPLPAATVSISHPTGYVKDASMLTNRKGVAEFPVLRATGTSTEGYSVNVVMPGFAPMQQNDVKVSIGKTTRLPIQLSEEIVERVKVVAKTDVVDLEETSSSTRFTDEFIQDLPVPGRFYQNVLTLAPGVQDADGDGNPNVHGSRDRDFKAEVSGISNVDPLTGQQMSQVNPNSIEEMEVISAGAGVEFSRAQGGFARILQKQGSNEFEGVFELYYRSSLLDGDGANNFNKTEDPDFDWFQPSFQLSGPIIKDTLWYRLSHEWIYRDLPQNTTKGISVVTDDQEIHADQLTWQASPRNKLALQYQRDPRSIGNFGVSSSRPETSALNIENQSEIASLTWTAPYSPKILVESRVAWQDFNTTIAPTERDIANDCIAGLSFIEEAQCFNIDTGVWSGSYNEDWNDHRQRLTVRGDATVYGGRIWGASHQFKFGAIVENERYTRQLERRPRVNFFLIDPSDDTDTGETTPELAAIIFGTFSAPEFTQITAKGITWGFYAEDQLKPAQNLTITLGARIDREEIRSDGRAPFDPEAESQEYIDLLQSGFPQQLAAQRTFTSYEAQRDFFSILAQTLEVPFREVFKRQSTAAQESEFWAQTRRAESIGTTNTNVAPRIAVAWDPWSNGKTKFAGTWGRYYDKIYLNIPLIELEPANANLAFDAGLVAGEWQITGLRNSINPAVNIQVVDRDLNTPYQDELTLAVERELWAETSVKLSYLNRKFRDQLQDYDLNHVPYDWGRCVQATLSNPELTIVPVVPGDPEYDAAIAPGDGIIDDCIGEIEIPNGQGTGGEGGGGVEDVDDIILQRPDGTADLYLQNPGWGDIYLVGNLNRIDYEAYVIELVRRQYRNWQMQASYTWSEAKGDGEDFAQSLGDDRSLIEDEKGYQAYDQRHVVKVNATTITPWGFRLGGSISWQSGLPYSILLRQPAFDAVPPPYQGLGAGGGARTRTIYPSGQRNDERNEPYWNLDVKFTKEFTIGRNLNAQVSAEVFNAFNDGTYIIYNPISEVGEQINGNNVAGRRFGRRWQLGIRFAF